jgi:hypothetical protein
LKRNKYIFLPHHHSPGFISRVGDRCGGERAHTMRDYGRALVLMSLASLACLLCGQSSIGEAFRRFGALVACYAAFAVSRSLWSRKFL